jgi:hypothetical protein
LRKYIIFDVADLHLVDFDKVCETSADTVRLSTNGEKTFIKWEGRKPYCISKLSNVIGPYTHEEIREIMLLPEWTREPEEFEEQEEFEPLSFEEAMEGNNGDEAMEEYAEEE